MGKRIVAFSADDSIGYLETCCLIKYENVSLVTDEFETPYNYEVLLNIAEDTDEIHSIEVNYAENLLNYIDKDDCLPDVGLLDYENEELKLDLKDVTLRELYKKILNQVL